MGYVKVKAKFSSLERPGQSAELELLVDTGAIYTVVPAELTQKLGLKPRGRRKFRLADGSIIEREFGYAEIEINGQVGITNLVFGKENDAAVLGVTTLEELGLQVDPMTGELKPMELLLYLFLRHYALEALPMPRSISSLRLFSRDDGFFLSLRRAKP